VWQSSAKEARLTAKKNVLKYPKDISTERRFQEISNRVGKVQL
jgi:hypothetical protein